MLHLVQQLDCTAHACAAWPPVASSPRQPPRPTPPDPRRAQATRRAGRGIARRCSRMQEQPRCAGVRPAGLAERWRRTRRSSSSSLDHPVGPPSSSSRPSSHSTSPSACAPTTCTSCHSPPSSTRHPLPSSASPRPSRRRPALPPRPIAQPGPPSSRACTIQHAAQPSEPVQWARLARDRTSRPTRSQGDELLPDSASLAASRPAPRALRRLCTVGRRGAGSLSQSRPSRARTSLARSPLCPRSAQLSRLSPSAPQRLSRLRPSSHPSTNDDDELAQVHDAARVGGPPRAIDGCAGQRRAMEQRRHGPGPRGQAGVEVVLVREHVGVGRVLVRPLSLRLRARRSLVTH